MSYTRRTEVKADKELCNLIIENLRHPEDPSLCLPALSRALALIKEGPIFETRLRSAFRELVEAANQFISTSLREEEINAIEERMTPCNCDKRNPAKMLLHDRIPGRNPVYNITHVVTSLFHLVCVAIQEIPPGKLEPGSLKWPGSAANLLPDGAQRTVDAFTQWVQYTRRSFPIWLLALYIPFCPSLMPSIQSSYEWRAAVVLGFHNLIRDIGSNMDQNDKPRFPTLEEALDHYSFFFQAHVTASSRSEDGEYWEKDSLQIYRDICLLLKNWKRLYFYHGKKDEDECRHSYIRIGRAMHSFIPQDDRPLLHPDMSDNFMEEVVDPYVILWKEYLSFTQRAECMSCWRSSEQASKMDKLRQCQCQLMRYCSRACQRYAWTTKPVPHKQHCKVLGDITKVQKLIYKDIHSDNGGTSSGAIPRFKESLKAAKIKEDTIVDIVNVLDQLAQARDDALLQKEQEHVSRLALSKN